jgi:two-component system, sensor histidine kinase
MTVHDAGSGDERVLLVPPTRRDGEVTQNLLQRAALDGRVCADLMGLAAEVRAGVGVVMLTDISLFDPAMAVVQAALAEQPAWSDVPVVVLLTRDRQYSATGAGILGSLTNVTVLDRPVSTRSMLSAVLAALRGRRRQYQLRDQLAAQAKVEQALRDADRQKDKFLATLAHELRNPLAPLRSGLQLLASPDIAEEQKQRVRQMMGRQLRLLIKLIDDLLDVSRISTGKVVLRKERFDLRHAIEGALESSQLWVSAAGHALTVELPPAPVWLAGDASRLEQVIANLVNNASKYTPNGGAIAIRLTEEAGQAVVSVQDNGIGIPADMLHSVFDLFTQVSRHLDRAQGGLGIGLSLVRQLVELHGGSVVAESAGPGLGSRFTVRLPVLADEGEPTQALPSSRLAEAATSGGAALPLSARPVAQIGTRLTDRRGH